MANARRPSSSGIRARACAGASAPAGTGRTDGGACWTRRAVLTKIPIPLRSRHFVAVPYLRDTKLDRLDQRPAASIAAEQLAGEVADVLIDFLQLGRQREEHDAEEALIGRHAEAGAVDTENAFGAQQTEHEVLVGLARWQCHARH